MIQNWILAWTASVVQLFVLSVVSTCCYYLSIDCPFLSVSGVQNVLFVIHNKIDYFFFAVYSTWQQYLRFSYLKCTRSADNTSFAGNRVITQTGYGWHENYHGAQGRRPVKVGEKGTDRDAVESSPLPSSPLPPRLEVGPLKSS